MGLAAPHRIAWHVAGPEAQREKVIVRDLDFFYENAQALFDINVAFFDKSVTALIGPSGCGKSTLLRVLNRIYGLYPGQRASGKVLVDGVNVLDGGTDVRRLRARIGMVAQKPMPFPMSIYENIAFGVGLYERLSRAELDERIEQALRRAALWDEAKDILGQSGLALSGGQQQRLCIARTVALNPEVILFDEPCSADEPDAPALRSLIAAHVAGTADVAVVAISASERGNRVDIAPRSPNSKRGSDDLGWAHSNC